MVLFFLRTIFTSWYREDKQAKPGCLAGLKRQIQKPWEDNSVRIYGEHYYRRGRFEEKELHKLFGDPLILCLDTIWTLGEIPRGQAKSKGPGGYKPDHTGLADIQVPTSQNRICGALRKDPWRITSQQSYTTFRAKATVNPH